MGQSRLHSLIEQVLNIGSGFIISIFIWAYVITPYLGIEYDTAQALNITIMFTSVSMVRGYLFRRLGNYFTERY